MRRAAIVTGVVVALVLLLLFALLALVTGIGAGGPETLFLLVLAIVALNFLLIPIAVVHALVRDDLAGIQRLIWIAIAVFITPGIALGAIVYFALGRPRTRELFRDLGREAPPHVEGGQSR